MANSRICTIEDCSNLLLAKGLCRKHYLRQYRHGSTDARRASPGDAAQYLRDVILPYAGDECLIWPFGRNSYGYPMATFEDHQEYVTRRVCYEVHGPAPSEHHQAAHSCGNGHLGCVTKRHLRWATRAENMSDKLAHGTLAWGEQSNLSKLSASDVAEIRSSIGAETQASIAARFGVDQSTISDIKRGKSWAHLPD